MTSIAAEVVARRNTAGPRISIVIPAMNEALNLGVVLPRLPQVHEVIVVDGGSVDGTVEAARRARPGVIAVAQVRRGKGNALATGFARATGDVVVMFDADGSADPREVTRFVETLTQGADFAKGSRRVAGGAAADLTAGRRIGDRLIGSLFNAAFGTRYSDLRYGFNAFWADLLPLLDLPDPTLPEPRSGEMVWGDGFEIETLISCRIAAAGVTVTEVPSVEKTRLFGESHLRSVTDALRVLRTLRVEHRRARAVRRLDKELARSREKLRVRSA